jgi:RNA polymerase sigma-70 factor (ECF subfamily)
MNDASQAVDRAQRGDREAFRQIVEQHSRAVFRLAYRMTSSESDAEDMVQETFLRAWKQLGSYDGRAAFGTWLHRICANCSLDHIRRRKNTRMDVVTELYAEPQSESPSPERMALSLEIGAILNPALDELTALERAAFIMRHYEGLRIEEISRALGVEANAAKHSVFRAVQKLRKALAPVRTGSR